MISGNESEMTTLFPEFSGRRRVRGESHGNKVV